MRCFRAALGVHPDEWQPNWIEPDTTRVWRSQLELDLAMARGFDPLYGLIGFTFMTLRGAERCEIVANTH
jgi:hypothetical protein